MSPSPEKITKNFDRLTDERWGDLVKTDDCPPRPDWVNVYLADNEGNARAEGRELFSVPFTPTAVQDESLPGEFNVLRNFPNPFNPSTTITYSLAQTENVTLTIFDILGQKTETLVQGIQPAGIYTVQWNARGVSSGVYFCRIRTGTDEKTLKMLLMR